MRGEQNTLRDLAQIVADRHDIPVSESEGFIAQMFAVIRDTLTSDSQVKVKGLGTFKVMTVRERASVSVNTGERVIIDAHPRLTFTPDSAMRDAVNKPFAHFETVPLNDGVTFDDPTPAVEDDERTQEDASLSPVEKTVTVSQPIAPSEETGGQVATEPALPQDEVVEVVVPSIEPQTEQFSEQLERNDVAEPATEQTEAARGDTPTATSVTVSPVETSEPSAPVTEALPEKAESNLTEHTHQHIHSSNTESDMSDNLNPSTDGGHLRATTGVLLLAILVFVAGIVIGRATSDITLADVSEYFMPSKKPVPTVVYRSITPRSKAVTKSKTEPSGKGKNKAAKPQKPHAASPAVPAARKPATAPATQQHSVAPQSAATQPQAKPAAQPAAKPAASQSDPWARYNSDARLRYGAYRITGVATTVTVKAGQTLTGIAKSHLGPGMECYLEVLNGSSAVNEGQRLKIPSLELKKKRKQ